MHSTVEIVQVTRGAEWWILVQEVLNTNGDGSFAVPPLWAVGNLQVSVEGAAQRVAVRAVRAVLREAEVADQATACFLNAVEVTEGRANSPRVLGPVRTPSIRVPWPFDVRVTALQKTSASVSTQP